MDLAELEAITDLYRLFDRLAQSLRENQRYHELFEVLKMKLRHRLGLPLFYDDRADSLNPSLREQLESGLLDACRDVGMELFRAGKPGEGWLYLQALGERDEAAAVLRTIPVTDASIEEIIHVAIYEGVDVGYGFELMLEHHGICNSITTFESVMRDRSRSEQQAAASRLLRSLFRDLVENVRADRQQREGTVPEAVSVYDLITGHEELFEDDRYHIDTSHLAAVVRAARLLDDSEDWRRAWELCEYGRRLAPVYHFADDEPFADFYGAHGRYFAVLLGEDDEAVREGIEFFRIRAETVAEEHEAAMCKEVYVDLLLRSGRADRAMAESIRLYPDRIPPVLLGALIDVAGREKMIDPLLEYARGRDDALTFGTLLALRLQGQNA